MKNVSVKVSQTKVKKGISFETVVNAISIETNKKIDIAKLTRAMTNGLVRKYEAKKELESRGLKSGFSVVNEFNFVVTIDNKKYFDLNELKSISGMSLKYPAHTHRSEGSKAAREKLHFALLSIIDDAMQFNSEVKSIFE